MRQELIDLVTRGVLTAKNAARKMRTVQTVLFADDVRDDVEHFEPYGFSSEAKTGAEVLAASLAGDRSHTIAVIITDRRFRPTGMKDGEVVVFDDLGRQVYLKRDGIFVEGKDSPVTVHTSGNVVLDAPLVKTTGDLEVAGNIVAKGTVNDLSGNGGSSMSAMRSVYNTHTHNGGHTPDQEM